MQSTFPGTDHAPSSGSRCLPAVASAPCAVVDGLNVIRVCGCTSPLLEILLDAVMRLFRDGYDVLCVSDANTRYELEEFQGKAAARAYLLLLDRFPAHFVECPGRTQADPYILAEATARDALVLSSDRFAKYAWRFPWVEERGRLIKIAAIRDHYYLDDQRCPIPTKLPPLVDELPCLIRRFHDLHDRRP